MIVINVLFSSVGRRVELVEAFREAKEELNLEGSLIGADMDELAPALRFVDKAYIVPRIKSENFIDSIIDICKKEKISLIIPTLDTELLVYSQNKERIERESGAKVMVSDEYVIDIIRNKIKTYEFLKSKGFKVPKLIREIEKKDYKFPLFIKPLDGSSSINNFKINNEKELQFFSSYVPNPMIQEFAEGQEYCVDVFTDFKGKLLSVSPKVRLAHRGGEITKGKIVLDKDIINLAKELCNTLKFSGEINFDCIKSKDGINIIEINGRFAGGSPMSFKAGANSPKKLYELLMGKKLDYSENIKDGFIALRFDSCVFL
ncbi:ATP-grasp domain-containing protein [Clostridium perfringens]|uniref:ATP-grasp domain-containing protein n=2 Tax=Clostridium perfringens TaxID=1502 RepID=A0AAW9IGD6_CLOPF|nr:ATP-grasp domain-containing protein [Clostridium perfringens]MDZ5008987.1 ATP-grasp domain-containing protein [Clostridium perfringens]MDZ5057355.1 ATP-grasp domain-containing protein [Clostridium perfringens]